MNRISKELDEIIGRNGGHHPPPPNEPPVATATGDDGDDDGEGHDADMAFKTAMATVLQQAMESEIDLHRDDVQNATLILLTRIAVEMGNIRYLLADALGGEDG